jgi:hypothetical protein
MCYEQRFFRSWITKPARKRERQADVPTQNSPFKSTTRRALSTKSPHWSEEWSEQKREKRHEPEEVI